MVKQNIKVFARIKPTKKMVAVYSVNNEDQDGASLEFVLPRDLPNGFVNNRRDYYKFRFQHVFDQRVKQEDIFEMTAKPVIDSVLAGYNGTIFAYGQTGTGKTFTITGGAEHYSDRGIIPRTLSYLYECTNKARNVCFNTYISYLEIYNEMGFDLLDSRNAAYHYEDLQKVAIMEDLDHNIHLKNLSMQQSINEEEALKLLFLGDTNRVIAETPVNQASTRSHCIFTVHIRKREPGCTTLMHSKLHLVDLAGSERASKTGLSGQLLTEAKYINRSLHYLEQVIIALSEPHRPHIPYRNSLLTSVLRDSLGGNCMTTMIATIAVDNGNLEESFSTCRFSQRVALIDNDAILNEILDPDLLIAHLKMEVQCLKEELTLVKGIQRNDQLTVEETQKLCELVKIFLDDPDPEVTLSVGADMRKIQYCFCRLKEMIMDKQEKRNVFSDVHQAATAAANKDFQGRHQSSEEISTLKKKRDQEICDLVKMWKKGHPFQVAYTKSDQALAGQGEINLSTPQENVNVMSADSEAQAVHHTKTVPQLSLANEDTSDFVGCEDNLTIDENTFLLKQRVAQARKLGEQLKVARDRIYDLKNQLALQRKQKATNDVTLNHTEAEEDALVIKNLCQHIEQEKKNYKATISLLKALRTEIEQRQLSLDKERVQVQKR